MVRQLSLKNFRNLAAVSINIEHPLVVFYGQNGQGKTNILEALSIAACGSSFRDQKKHLWLPFSAPEHSFSNLWLKTDTELEHKVVVALATANMSAQIKVWRNDVPVNMNEFIGEIPVVVFRPEDMNLFILDTVLRRSFLDSVLFQVFPLYRQAYAQSKKTLTNRNALLKALQKNEASLSELEFWNQQYTQDSATLQHYRSVLLAYLDQQISNIYQAFSHESIPLQVVYQKSVFTNDSSQLGLEKARGFTLSGAHRDDFAIYTANHDTPWTVTSSRGEMRTLILALKSIIVQFLAEKLEHKPILLLDDILSEFDNERQELVLSWTSQYQLFLTVAGNLETTLKGQKFRVSQGSIID